MWAAGDVVIVRVHAPGTAEVCRCELAAGHTCDVCCAARVFGYRGPFGTFAAAPAITIDHYEYQVGKAGPGCCLDGGLFCGHLDWELCELEGGVPSSQCLGDKDGDGIDDACQPPPSGACTGSDWCIELSQDVCETLDFGEYQGDGTTCTSDCPADLNGDGIVSASDLGILLGSWGPCAGCPADLDGDGVVSASDLGQLLGGWGECPEVSGVCPNGAEGACCGLPANGTPGCEFEPCCEAVCTAFDGALAFCCEDGWDDNCVFAAMDICAVDPDIGCE